MNREIKFRGKCAKSGDWVYGDLIHGVGLKDGCVFILPCRVNLAYVKHCDPLDGVMVNPETVGQYTGLKDKDGNEIYEGDKFEGDEGVDFYVVEWIDEEAIFGVSLYGQAISFGEGSQEVYDSEISIIDRNVIGVNDMREDLVIGTIHDNPKLIK